MDTQGNAGKGQGNMDTTSITNVAHHAMANAFAKDDVAGAVKEAQQQVLAAVADALHHAAILIDSDTFRRAMAALHPDALMNVEKHGMMAGYYGDVLASVAMKGD